MNTEIVKSCIQHDRVKSLRESKGYTIKGLADILGVKYQSIQNIEKPNGVKQPSYISDLASTLDVSVDYLLGKEDVIAPCTFKFERLEFKFESEDKANCNAAYDIESDQQKSLTVDYEWIKNTLHRAPNNAMKIMTPQDTSMEPFFTKNDILLVDTNDVKASNDIYIYKDFDTVHISRLQIKQGKVFGLYDNTAYETTELSDNHQIFGRVIYLWRKNPMI